MGERLRVLHEVAEAVEEVIEAQDWYFEQEPGAGLDDAFGAELEAVYTAIKMEQPKRADYLYGTHRCYFGRFPYYVVYLFPNDSEAVVVAVVHQRREPGYWRKRLSTELLEKLQRL